MMEHQNFVLNKGLQAKASTKASGGGLGRSGRRREDRCEECGAAEVKGL